MVKQSRLSRVERATRKEHGRKTPEEIFMDAVADLNAQIAGAPRKGSPATTQHRIVENTLSGERRIVKDEVEDLSE